MRSSQAVSTLVDNLYYLLYIMYLKLVKTQNKREEIAAYRRGFGGLIDPLRSFYYGAQLGTMRA